MKTNPNLAYSKTETEKLARIGNAGRALAEAAFVNNVSIYDLVPLVVALAKKELLK